MKTPWKYSKEMLRILNCQTLTWSSVMFALLDPLTPRSLTRSSWTRHLARSTTRVRVILKSTSSDVDIIWCICKTAKILVEQVSHIPLVNFDSRYCIHILHFRYWHAVPADSDLHGKYSSVFPSQDLNARCKLPHYVIISQLHFNYIHKKNLLLNCIFMQHIQKKANDWNVKMEVIAGNI